MARKHVRYFIGFVFILTFIFTFSGPQAIPLAHAASFTVNSTTDAVDANPGNGVCATAGAVCTLRAAIQEANALAGPDTINLPAGTYTLTIGGAGENNAATGDLDILSTGGNVTIIGTGAPVIDAGGIDRALHVIGATVDITGVTIQGGSVTGSGGGLYNQVGTVTIRASIIRGNTATVSGGGIFNEFGTINILQNSTIGGSGTPNTAPNGGGIFTQYSSSQGTNLVTITLSSVSFNVATTGSGGGIHASDDGDLNISDSDITSNQANSGIGGGVFSTNAVVAASTTLTLNNVTIVNNTAGAGAGIGLQNITTASITNTAFTNNDASGTAGGGGIYNVTSANGTTTLTLTNISITGSDAAGTGGGGGIRNSVTGAGTGRIIINNGTISGNTSAADGGGLHNSVGGNVLINVSTIANNAANGSNGGGGIFNAGTLTLNDSTVDNNDSNAGGSFGGGIHNTGATTTLNINSSTVSNNGAPTGGGVYTTASSNPVNITNSTISGNSSGTDGGGLYNDQGTMNLSSVTVANNVANGGDGGGLFNSNNAASVLNFTNSLIATNLTGNNGPDCSNAGAGSLISGDFNLIGNNSGCTFTGTTTNNITNPPGGPRIGALASNGGPTQTHRLQGPPTASAAIDTGNCPGLTTDQRGGTFVRPVDLASITDGSAGFCDIGAFEAQSDTTALIGDRVWSDANANGIQEFGEVGLANVTVRLLDSSGTTVQGTATTDGNGLYSFNNAAAGTHIVEFVLPGATFRFSPQNQGGDDTVDSDADTITGRTAPFLVNAGDTVDIQDAGMFQVSSIGDQVWIDTNGNGIRDGAETGGVNNVIVNLYNTSNTLIASAGTNASGIYSLPNIAPGTYYLEFVLPPGFQFTLQDQGGDDTLDSDANPGNGQTATFVLSENQTLTQWDAGAIQLASIGDFVWDDLDGDGVQDVGEPGLDNVVVNLLDGTGNPLVPPQSDTTDATGNYSFTIVPGTYIVEFVLPAGRAFSAQDQGGDDALDSDANPANGRTAQIVLTSGTNLTNVDAGMFLPVTIGDFVWQDTDADGIQDTLPIPEPGLLGATVTLLSSTGAPLTPPQQVVTPASGAYQFNVPPGSYIVDVDPPANTPVYAFSTANAGGDDTVDSDFNQATGRTAVITVAPGATNNTVDAGLHLSTTVSGCVWNDANSNGAQEVGEGRQNGVTVRVFDSTGATVIVTGTTTAGGGDCLTDGNNFTLTGVPAGPIILEVVPPAGQGFAPQDATAPPDDTIDSDVNAVTGRLDLNLAPQGSTDVDAGLISAVSIGDFVWRDNDNDGIQDAGEPGIDGITVNLYASNGSTLLGSDVTSGGGLYNFVAPTGTYVIEVVLPVGFSFSPQDAPTGTDATDSDVNPGDGRITATVNANNSTFDAGLVANVNITGFVWDDTGAPNVQDGEPGRDGVTVNLRDSTGATVLFTTTTSGGGNYSFLQRVPATYILEIVAPANTGFVLPNAAVPANDAIDSDVDQFTGRVNLPLAPGINADIDAGLVPAVTFGDFVWIDANENDVQDGGEVGLAGVTVNLRSTAAGNPILNTVVTNGTGNYSFTAPAGPYIVEVVRPTGYVFADPNIGGDDTADSDVAPAGLVATASVNVTVNANDNTIDAGLQPTAAIGDFVWNDVNVNGVQDVGELGIQGVTVNLRDAANTTTLATDTTDANGLYSFDNLTPGNYLVQFITPTGFASTQLDQGGDDALDSDVPAFQTGSLVSPQVTIVVGTPNATIDAGFFQITAIGDLIWDDLDADGIRDTTPTAEPGLNNVAVGLTWAGADGDFTTAGDNLTFSTNTNATGNYSFTNIPAGLYRLQVTPPASYVFTLQNVGTDETVDSDADATGLVDNITLTAGPANNNVDVGLYIPAGITGFVWDDLDFDGIQDGGEPGRANITVDLLDAACTTSVQLTTTTNGSGIYTFTNAPPGAHCIRFVAPAGFVFSPQDAVTDDTIDSDPDPATGITASFTLVAQQSLTDIDAGMLQPVTIGDFVWVDIDLDGIQDTGEPGWNGVTVNLYLTSNLAAPFATTVTANGGAYQFVVPAGDYTLEFVPPTNFGFTVQDANSNTNDTIDSDVDAATGPTFGRVTLPTLNSGDTQNTWDAGLIQLSTLPLSITKTSVDLSATTGLAPGDPVGWIICVTNPNASSVTNVIIGDNVDVASQTLVTGSIEFGVGTACPTITPVAGDYSVSGPTPVADTNNISVSIPTLTAGQVGILYFEVTLDDPGASFLPSTLPQDGSNAGVMHMSSLLLAIGGLLLYGRRRWLVVTILIVAGVVALGPLQGLYAQDSSQTSTANALQSSQGRWVRYEASAPGVELTGYWESLALSQASVGQYLVSDDPDAALTLPFVGTKVKIRYVSLWDSAVTSVSIDNGLVATLSDYNAHGEAQILTTEEFLLPEGSHTLHIQSTGEAANGSAQGPVLAIDAIDVWMPDSTNDDGDNDPDSTNITGVVWYDTNHDGKLDPSDWLLEGVTVYLYLDNGANDLLLAERVTDQDGRYTFTNLRPAHYWVVVHRETLPDGIDRRSINWEPIDVEAPFSGDVIIPATPGAQVRSFIRGRAWLDKDKNSVVSDADEALGGVTVNLYSDDGDRVFDPSDDGDYVIGTQTSNGTGDYSFNDLLPGIYWVVVDVENLPATADANQTWNLLWVRVPKIKTIDLLLVAAPETHELGGAAWLDVDRSNTLTEDDTTLPGVTVSLYQDDGNNYFDSAGDTFVNTLTTDVQGHYGFEQLENGIYWLMPHMDALPAEALTPQIWPPFWVRVPAVDNADILLIPAPAGADVDYPTGPASLFGTVFNDDNGNREWDEGVESGLEGVQVSLFYDDGNGEFGGDYEIAITQTDASGRYQFDALGAGAFWVQINESTLPPKYMDTVAYGKHGEQNPQKEVIDITNNEAAAVVQGPLFAYALDTDGDGSPDGREGSGDRDNDNIPNNEDPFDPSGIVFGVDPNGNTIPLENVEVRLVYEADGEWVLADTIQPNPQKTGYKGQYRFDLNVTAGEEGNGIPRVGARTFRLEVDSLPLAHRFPSATFAPTGTFVGTAGNGEITPFSEIPEVEESEESAATLEYYVEFALGRGDADVVNNHIPIDRPEIILSPTVNNTACVNWTGGTQQCATGQATLQSNAEFTLVAVAPAASTGGPTQTLTYNHTLTNTGNQSDRYRISFPAGTQGWVQTLTVLSGTTTLATLSPGQTFDTTTPLVPGGTLTLRHNITIAAGAADGTVDTTTISASSLEALAAGTTLSQSSANTTTVDAACIIGSVFNDINGTGFPPDLNEGLGNVRLVIQDSQGATPSIEVRTDGSGNYRANLPSGTFSVQLDPATLPPGVVVFLPPTPTNGQYPNLTINTTDATCLRADFRLNLLDPAITKAASVAQADPGDTITYTITISNPFNSGPMTNIVISDTLPSFVTFASGSVTTTAPLPTPATQTITPPPVQTVTFTMGSTFILGPGQNIIVTISVTVNQDVPRSSTLTNTANLNYTTANGTLTTEASNPVIVQVPADTTGTAGEDTDGTGTDATGSGTGTEEDFGTGGAVGVGEDAGPDTLPTTGYMPIEWQNGSFSTTQTAKLSGEGRILVILLAILSLIAGAALLYVHNNSEQLYQWFQRQPRILDKSFVGLIMLFLIVGGFGLIYVANDMLGVVDVDNLVGFNNNALPDENDRIALNEDGTSDANIDGVSDGVSNEAGLPTIPLPRPDGDTRRVLIPALDVYTKLVEAPIQGSTWDVSDFFDELAHLEGTAVPGTAGNTVIAGHVTTTRGLGPFRNLDQILPGESVIVKDYDVEYTYVVTEVYEVSPKDIEVTYNTNNAMLTLISCADWNPARRTYNKRIVVRAELYQWRILSGTESDVYIQELGELSRHEVGMDEALELTGTWDEVQSYNASETSYFYSEDKDAAMTYTFNGDKFRLHYVMYQNFGIFDVYLDDKLVMTVDSYSPYSGFITTEVFQIEPGRHEIRIVNTGEANAKSKGNTLGLDAIDVWR